MGLRLSAAAIALAVACGEGDGDGGPGSPSDAAAPDAAGSVPDAGAPIDAAAGCQATAPPGPRAAFTVPRSVEAEFDLYVVGLSSTLPTCPLKINDEPLIRAAGFAWSPDGSMLAYERISGIAVVDMSGPIPGAPSLIEAEAGAELFRLSWSPDSRWLVYHSRATSGPVTIDIWLVRVTGAAPGTPQRITETQPYYQGGGVVWHPTSSSLLFDHGPVGGGEELFWLPVGPGGPGASRSIGWAWTFDFSPAGDRIAYLDTTSLNYKLRVRRLVDDQPGAPRTLSNDPGPHLWSFSWSPDGRRILYSTAFSHEA